MLNKLSWTLSACKSDLHKIFARAVFGPSWQTLKYRCVDLLFPSQPVFCQFSFSMNTERWEDKSWNASSVCLWADGTTEVSYVADRWAGRSELCFLRIRTGREFTDMPAPCVFNNLEAACFMIISCFSNSFYPDEGNDGAGGEQPPAEHPILSKRRSPDRTSIHAAHQSQFCEEMASAGCG